MKKDEINGTLPSIAELKRRITATEESIATRFWQGEPVAELVAMRARFIDAFLNELWNQTFEEEIPCALIAVGGYGRGELHPKSDIDLLILVRHNRDKTEKLEAFVRLLWDLRLDIGHSVRTVSECRSEASTDVTVFTAISERRLIAGSARLADDLDRALNRGSIWPIQKFFTAKTSEQNQRHEDYGDVEYGLEPNVKTSPGGLRDIQTISWLTNRYCGSSDLHELSNLGLLIPDEQRTLIEGREFLWRIRFALHLLAKRQQDQLLFDHQREIAEAFGYQDTEGMLAVELFMRDYYRIVLALREVNDILLQHFNEAVLPRRRRLKILPINERFQKCNDYIEVTDSSVFLNNPEALMEIFVVMANRPDILGVRANTIRLIKRHLDLVDDAFRSHPTVSKLFLDLLKSPHNVVSQLTRMRRYGLLGKFIPEFGRVIGQMQHDLFHIYTVDAHTMALIRNLRRMFMPEYAESFGLAATVAQEIPRIELLYIAGIFHDIGKGRSGNHSSLGAIDVDNFCAKLGLPQDDRELVVWLVQEHLSMSMTAQREDPSDPDVAARFAATVQSPMRARYLLCLTVADICATNPDLFNAWRATLLARLYFATMNQLELGGEIANEIQSQVAERKRETSAELDTSGIVGVNLDPLWDDTDNDFLLHHSAKNLAAIAAALNQQIKSDDVIALVLDRPSPGHEKSVVEIFISTPDRPNLFSDCCTALDRMNLQIVGANITTGKSSRCYDSFIVITDNGFSSAASSPERIRQSLLRALNSAPETHKPPQRRIARQLMQFKRPTKVTISEVDDSGVATLTLTTSDRPGLLELVGRMFVELGIELHQARIATLGERVEDIFTVSFQCTPDSTTRVPVDTLIREMESRIDEELVYVTS